jgi:hypothetical protein
MVVEQVIAVDAAAAVVETVAVDVVATAVVWPASALCFLLWFDVLVGR